MEEVNLRFQHISEQIFNCLDNESLINCQEVCRSWNIYLNGQKFCQARIILETVKKTHKVGNSWLEVFKKCNTKTIMDLRIAVEHIYKELITSMYKELDFSPLHVAARFGQLTLFNDILQKVENKFPTDGQGRTTLHHAASKDHLQIYESIVTINGNISPYLINVNIKFCPKPTPLHSAAANNSLKVCRFIVENNPDYNTWASTTNGNTPLHTAAWRGHIEVYKIIMGKVKDRNPRDKFGKTPLHWAAMRGHFEMCKLILENVNDKSPADNYGKTPWHMAQGSRICDLFPRI